MPRVTIISADGERTDLDADAPTTVMAAATAQGIDGIVGECGGNAMCATCHVYVDDDHLHRLPSVSEDEDAMLDAVASPRRPSSRLSCQIPLCDATDGLVVRLPETQI